MSTLRRRSAAGAERGGAGSRNLGVFTPSRINFTGARGGDGEGRGRGKEIKKEKKTGRTKQYLGEGRSALDSD